MSAVRSRWAPIVVVSAALAGTLDVAGVQSPLRLAVMVWFVLVCPGLAIVRLMRLEDAVAELALAVAMSIALALAVGGVALYSGLWAPGATLAILIAITVGAAGAPKAWFRGAARP